MKQVLETSDGGNETQLQTLMALLASVSGEMITIADELRKNPVVRQAIRGCDLREYRGAFRFDGKAFYSFEAYVEADLPDGCLVCWLVDINWTPSGWEVHRTISRNVDSRDDVIREFPVVFSQSFSEFVSKAVDAMHEFVESARSYHFT